MSNDYDYSRYTPVDNTGKAFTPFKSAYKNIRFALSVVGTYPVDESDMANLVGIAFKIYGDTSLWRMLLSFNGISNQVQDVYPGLILNYPSKSDVIAYLSKQQTNQTQTFTI
jgi:nucleoid-associated protein YgaU